MVREYRCFDFVLVIMIIIVFAEGSHFDLACKVGVFWVSERHSSEQTGMFFSKQPKE